MPVLGIPNDDFSVIPAIDVGERGVDYAYVMWFMDVKPWKCVCGLTNHGRNERCADWRCRKVRERSE
jgi:hypothetical protein